MYIHSNPNRPTGWLTNCMFQAILAKSVDRQIKRKTQDGGY